MPFVDGNCIVFECPSGNLLVGDIVNEPARYRTPVRGLCHLPAAGILKATAAQEEVFSVDNAQIFLIDANHYNAVKEALEANPMAFPDVGFLEWPRGRIGIAFGFVAAGDLFDCEFAGDGTYRIDVSLIRSGQPVKTSEVLNERELLRRVISKMNTLVCAKCFSAEICTHPTLGVSPRAKKAKTDWAAAMADWAIEQGWTASPEDGSFGQVTPICPKCRIT